MPTSARTDLFDAIAAEAADESPLWGEALRPDPEPEPVFGPLVPVRFALGLETIYEGYLVHYGRARLFTPADEEAALLLGDYLYAHGLARIAATGDIGAVGSLAELISTCAALRGDGGDGDDEAWLESVRRLGGAPAPAAVAQAVAAHRRRLVSSRP